MQGVTLAIGVLGSILVLLLRPGYALAGYFAILVWYPDYLRVSIGTIDISVGRIVVAVLLLRCLCDDRLRGKFVWSRLDKWVAFNMAVYVGMYFITRPLTGLVIENRGGFLVDTSFSYFAARLILTDKKALTSFVKGVGVVLAALAVLGVAEAVTHRYFFAALKHFRTWNTPLGDFAEAERRFGFSRANGPFSHSIMFGSCFVMFLPLIWALRRQRGNWASLAKLLSAMAVIGVVSSMSSGPWGMLLVVILCMVMERYRDRAKSVLGLFVLMCVLVGIVSNRPFYHVLLELGNLGRGDWYQRARLIDVGIKDFNEWWLAGYGGVDPGWGAMYFNDDHTDVNNQFLLAGMECGILGVIALLAVFARALRDLVRAFKAAADEQLRSMYWSLGSVLIGVFVLWQGVSSFGQNNALFYIILGIVGSSVGFAQCAAARQGRVVDRL
jgi:hypothetical protein